MFMDLIVYMRILSVLILMAMVGGYFTWLYELREEELRGSESMGWSPFPPPWDAPDGLGQR